MGREEYRKLLEQRRSWYKTIKKIYCPCLKTDVTFNAKGFYHIRYDGTGKERTIDEQTIRLNALPMVPYIIKNALNIYEHRKLMDIEYWALKDKLSREDFPIIVVLRKIKNGIVTYHSVMLDKPKTKRPSTE